MATVSHQPPVGVQERRRWSWQLFAPEVWACLTIIVMWLSVLFDAIFGPDIVAASSSGDTATVPSAVVVAVFAFLGTWVVARYAFRRERKE